ncbi:MAG: flippase-like domain-containing protein [Bacteroidetes bacterium]|nr:flippase-like domain-containing protein [Bacteroidota bacterium]
MDDQKTNQSASTDWNKVVKRLSVIVGIGFLVNIIIVVFLSESFDPTIFLTFKPEYILLAFIIAVVPIYLHGYTLKIWGDFFKYNFNFKEAVNVSATSLLGSAVTPTMFGGGPLKLGLLMMNGFRMGQAAAVVTIGSIQDIIAFIVLVISSIYLSETVDMSMLFDKIVHLDFNLIQYLIIAGVLIGGILIAKIVIARSTFGMKIIRAIRRTFIDFKASYQLIIQNGKLYFLWTTVINIIRWVSIYAILMILVAGLGISKIDYLEIWSLQWIVFSGMTFTPLPGGAGGAEATFYFVYKSFFSEDIIVGLILVWRFFEAYFRLIFAALLVVFFSRKKIKA